jgi:hypothetical protein
MGGRIMGAKICLHLDNPADPHTIRKPVYEMLTEQLKGHRFRASAIKVAGKGGHLCI